MGRGEIIIMVLVIALLLFLVISTVFLVNAADTNRFIHEGVILNVSVIPKGGFHGRPSTKFEFEDKVIILDAEFRGSFVRGKSYKLLRKGFSLKLEEKEK